MPNKDLDLLPDFKTLLKEMNFDLEKLVIQPDSGSNMEYSQDISPLEFLQESVAKFKIFSAKSPQRGFFLPISCCSVAFPPCSVGFFAPDFPRFP